MSEHDNLVLSESEAHINRDIFQSSLKPSEAIPDQTSPSVGEGSLSSISENANSFLAELEDMMRREFFDALLLVDEECQGTTMDCLRKRYSYESLSDNGVVRLLSLEPGSKNSPLRGSLVQGRVGILPKYEALSYAWDSQDQPCYIELVGGRIPITRSLHSALVRLRPNGRNRLLWADALCINQGDNLEKNRQILLMPQIYSSASRVIAYLGEEAESSDLALQLHEKIGETDFSSLPEKSVTPEWLEASGLQGFQHPAWIALAAFWRRPWFRRIWVVQEFALAQDVLMICGERKMSWKNFISATTKTNDFNLLRWSAGPEDTFDSVAKAHSGSASMSAMLGVKSCLNLGLALPHYVRSYCDCDISSLYELDDTLPCLKDIILALRQEPALINPVVQFITDFTETCGFNGSNSFMRPSLLDLLVMFSASEATDPRDRLFALLGLAKDGDDENFRPDYNEPVESVVQRFALAFVQKGEGMKALYLAGLSSKPSPLPSWVPDWTIPGLIQRTSLCVRNSASYSTATETPPRIRIGDWADLLVVSGSRMEVVSRVGMDASGVWTPDRDSANISLLKPFFDEADDIIPPESEDSYAATGESMFDVQWRTLIGNRAMNFAEAPEEYALQYQNCRRLFENSALETLTFCEYSQSMNLYFGCLAGIILSYRLCATQNGFVGLVPLSTRVGDTICVFNGGAMPFVLRESTEHKGWSRLVGGCYIHGMMKGEALRSQRWKEEDIFLH